MHLQCLSQHASYPPNIVANHFSMSSTNKTLLRWKYGIYLNMQAIHITHYCGHSFVHVIHFYLLTSYTLSIYIVEFL